MSEKEGSAENDNKWEYEIGEREEEDERRLK